MYVKVQGAHGVESTHAEPQHIIDNVDALVATYSRGGSRAPAVTETTRQWWSAQKAAILDRRICSNPLGVVATAAACMSSSPLENFHRQLNRLMHVRRVREATMHGFLMHFMFR